MMHAYFDILYKDRFEEVFKGTWIYEHPTNQRGEYLVLSFNFSRLDPAPGKLENSFLQNVKLVSSDFVRKYSEYLNEVERYRDQIDRSDSAADILSLLLQCCKASQRKLFVLIDEYDNFANTILASVGPGVLN